MVVMMAGEVFSQFIARSVVGGDEAANNSSIFKHRQIAIRRTLRHSRSDLDDFENRHRSTRGPQCVDEYSPIGGVALTIAAEALVSGVMNVNRVEGHGVESLRL